MPMIFTNRAKTQIARNITVVDTVIQLSSGAGALFPSPASSAEFFPLTLVSVNSPQSYEIAYCVARNGDALTVIRGQEGTAAQPFLSGDVATLNDTAALFRRVPQAGDLGAFSPEVAAAPGGYRFNAIVRDATTPRLFWINAVDGNTTAPADGNTTWLKFSLDDLVRRSMLKDYVTTDAQGDEKVASVDILSGVPRLFTQAGKEYDLQVKGDYAYKSDLDPFVRTGGLGNPNQIGTPLIGYNTWNNQFFVMDELSRFHFMQGAGDYATNAALADYVRKSDFTGNITATNGYAQLPNGLIFQWGNMQATNGTYNFNTSFPNKALQVFATNTTAQGDYVDNAFGYAVNNSQFFLATKQSTNSGVINGFPCAWLAIGY